MSASPQTAGPSTATQSPDEVVYENKRFNIVREGAAEILNAQHPNPTKNGDSQQSVFYNPIQQFNRDLSVIAIRVFAEDLANIRQARNERRLQKKIEGGRKGQKRKRGLDAEHDGASQGSKEKESPFVERKLAAAEGVGTLAIRSMEDVCEQPKQIAEACPFREKKPMALHGAQDTKDDNATSAEDAIMVNGYEALELATTSQQAFAAQKGDNTQVEEGEVIQDQEEVEKTRNGNPEPGTSTGSCEEVRNGDVQDDHCNADGIPTCPKSMKDRKVLSSAPSPFRILDALSATGLRALRYVKEISAVTSVTANDFSAPATKAIRLNAMHNKVADRVQTSTADAKAVMYNAAAPGNYAFQVIDLDPYGTAVPFLDAAVQAVTDGGLLCITCTDSGVFASVAWLEKTYSQYSGLPWKGPQSHEAGIRLILNAIAVTAARYSLAIEPLLSLSIDFYIRIFVRIRKSAADVKFLASKTMAVCNCDQGCGSWSIQYLGQSREKRAKNNESFYTFSLPQAPSSSPRCEHCGFKTHLAGPMWGGPLHNPHFIARILAILPSLDASIYGTIPRIEGMLTLAMNETLDQEPPDADTSALGTPEVAHPVVEETQSLDPHASSPAPSPTTFEPFPSLNPALRDPHPFFLHLATLSRTLHTPCPSDAEFRGALLHLGYRSTRSHTNPGSIRTDAPFSVVWEIMREWVRQKHPNQKEGRIKEGTSGWGIMQKDRSKRRVLDAKKELAEAVENGKDLKSLKEAVEAALYRIGKSEEEDNQDGNRESGGKPRELDVVFDKKKGEKEMGGRKMVRYQVNPRADWGPMRKAKGGG